MVGAHASARWVRPLVAGSFAAVLWLGASGARADAVVAVQLRNAAGTPAEGKVILETDDGKHVADCTTTAAGTCEMAAVPGGSYKARVEPKVGKAPARRGVMIPPTGRVSLIVNTES